MTTQRLVRIDFSKGMLGARDSRLVKDGYGTVIANAEFTSGIAKPVKAPVCLPDIAVPTGTIDMFEFDGVWYFSGSPRSYVAEKKNGISRVYYTSSNELPMKLIDGVKGRIGIQPPSYALTVTVSAKLGIGGLAATFVPDSTGGLWTDATSTRNLRYTIGLRNGSGASAVYGDTLPCVDVPVSEKGVVKLTWDPIAVNADNIIVYGREQDAVWVLAVLPATATSWTDDGSAIPTKISDENSNVAKVQSEYVRREHEGGEGRRDNEPMAGSDDGSGIDGWGGENKSGWDHDDSGSWGD